MYKKIDRLSEAGRPATSSPAEVHPLRAWRYSQGLSQIEIARRLDTSEATLSRIELGLMDPTFTTMRRIMAVTEDAVTADMLIRWSKRSDVKRMPAPGPREKALQAGALTYYLGRRCKRGHLADRHIATGQCVDCIAEDLRAKATPAPAPAAAKSRRPARRKPGEPDTACA